MGYREGEHELAGAFRATCLQYARRAEPPVGVFLSGGVDSQAVLRAAVIAGEEGGWRDEVWAYSFTREDRESRDFILARETSEDVGVRFVPVILPTDLAALFAYVQLAVHVGLTGKTQIECFWPRLHAMQAAQAGGARTILTGDGGDGYFALSKKAMIHYRDTIERMDEYRAWYFGREDWSQTESIRRCADALGLGVLYPLAEPALLEACRGWSWERLNKPKQKQPIRDAFQLPALPPHTNLQLGDSGIAELFADLASARGASSARRMYNIEIEAARSAQASLLGA